MGYDMPVQAAPPDEENTDLRRNVWDMSPICQVLRSSTW